VIKRWLVGMLAMNGVVMNGVLAQEGYAPPGAYSSQWGMNAPNGGSDLTNLYGGYQYEAPYLNAQSMPPDSYAPYAAPGYDPSQYAGPYGYVPAPRYGDAYGPPAFPDHYGYDAEDWSSPHYAVPAPPGDAAVEGNRPVFRPFDRDYLRFIQESGANRYGGWRARPVSPYPGQASYAAPGFGVPERAYPGYPVIRDYTASYGGYPPVSNYWPAPAYGPPMWSGEFDDEYVPPPPGDDTSYGGFPAEPGYEIWPAWQSGYLDKSEIPAPSEVPLPLPAIPHESVLTEPVLPSTPGTLTRAAPATVAPTAIDEPPSATDAPASKETVPLSNE
jgi:hypothetical protein